MNAKVLVMVTCLLGVVKGFSQDTVEALRVLSWFEKEFSSENPRKEVFQKRNAEVLLKKYFTGAELNVRLNYLASFPAPTLESSALFHDVEHLSASNTRAFKDSVIVERVYLTSTGPASIVYTLVRESSVYMTGTWKIEQVVIPSLSIKPREAPRPKAEEASRMSTV